MLVVLITESSKNVARLGGLWRGVQYNLIDIGIAGPQEAVHQQLSLQSWYGAQGGKRLFYYRFQPQFDPEVDTELDNTSPEFFNYMQQMAAQTYAQDQYKIAAFLQNMAIG